MIARFRSALVSQLLGIAIERFKTGKILNRHWIPQPLQHLPIGGEVDITVAQYFVHELEESLPMVSCTEPSTVVEEAERGSVRLVVAIKVLDEHFVHFVLFSWIGAGVSHRAATTSVVLPHDHAYYRTIGISMDESSRTLPKYSPTSQRPGNDLVGHGVIMHS